MNGKHKDSWKPGRYSEKPEKPSPDETVEFDAPMLDELVKKSTEVEEETERV